MSLATTDVDLSDFFFANGGFKDLSGNRAEYEMLSYHTDERKSCDGAEFLGPTTPLPLSDTDGRTALALEGGSFANIPDPLPDYVRRPALEQETLKVLRDERHPIVTLVGRGGIGKTSLALEVAHDMAAAGDFFAIIWFSARDIDLLPSGPKLVSPGVLTKDEISVAFADLMNPTWRMIEGFTPVQFLSDCLTGKEFKGEPILLVFDNFETVRNPGELYQFIDAYVRLPNKVLLTSRFRDFKADYPISVLGMARDEFDEMVRTTAQRLGVSDLLTSKYLNDLFSEADGHPYIAKVLLGELARTKRPGSIERVMASRDEILGALFERTFSSISPAAQRVFLTLCNWRSVVPRLALEGALLRPANERLDIDRALETLEQSFLSRFLMQPTKMEVSFVYRSLRMSSGGVNFRSAL